MLHSALPVLFTLFLWWFSTGAILFLDGLPRWTYKWTMLTATAVLAASLWGLYAVRADTSVWGAYIGFSCALGVWAWNEVAFLMGYLTGSRRTPCPADARGWARFKHCSGVILYHELGILAGGAAIVLLSWGAQNQVGALVYGVLWVMRLSTKLNLFLGVPYAPSDFLPDHLRYIETCFAKRAMNALFPVSVTLGAILGTVLVLGAMAPHASAFDAAAHIILATLVWLAILEHWFLVLPIPSASLWGWGLRSRRSYSGSAEGPPLLRSIPDGPA